MLLAMLLLTLAASCSWSDEARLEVIADTSLQAHPSEIDQNSGASPNIRIKGNEHHMLLKLDPTPIRGWRVQSARLRLHAAGPHMLRTLGISTGRGSRLYKDALQRMRQQLSRMEATFREQLAEVLYEQEARRPPREEKHCKPGHEECRLTHLCPRRWYLRDCA